jgi:hypothetical protein
MRGVRARRLRRIKSKAAIKQTDSSVLRFERGPLDRVEAWFAIIANATIIFALVIAWWTYRAQIEQAKRDTSFDLVAEFHTGELLLAQRRLALEMTRTDIEVLRDVTVPRHAIEAIIRELVSTSSDPLEVRQEIVSIVGFFDLVQICVSSETCDATVAQAHLGETAGRYACLLLPYTDSIRDANLLDGLGDELRTFVSYEERC